MTKGKKNIADFQKAMQSKTQFIVPDAEGEMSEMPAIEEPEIELPSAVHTIDSEILVIDEEIAGKLRILAESSGREYDELIRHALSHYLMLKGLRLRDALIKLYKKEISLKDL
jgi:hypothetical protein